ncbi:MAG: hypothetical protein ACHQZQ_01295 [SAR324 cluster bacterium]
MINDYISLSSRRGFNKSVGLVRLVNGIVQHLGSGENFAEIVDGLEKNKEVEKSQIGPILNAIVMDRERYSSISFNLPADINAFEPITAEVGKWNRLDIVVAYHHPQLGITLVNPKLPSHWESVRELNRDELAVVYMKAVDEKDKPLVGPALEQIKNLFYGRPFSGTEAFGGAAPRPSAPAPKPATAPRAAQPAPAPRAAPQAAAAPDAQEPALPPPPAAGGKRKVTPKYSVVVSNELFHNGNVEAWKNIVESYKIKFPGLDVHIFHDGQRVNNINALFKWGKVKHGDAILVSVSGEEIKGVAKLQAYLREGASIRYTNFLKKDVNKVLNLF